MNVPLRQLIDYSPYLNDHFVITVDDEVQVQAEMVQAELLENGDSLGHGREPFTLIFKLEQGVELSQRLYEVGHDSAGQHQMFLVPVYSREPGRFMQAIFN